MPTVKAKKRHRVHVSFLVSVALAGCFVFVGCQTTSPRSESSVSVARPAMTPSTPTPIPIFLATLQQENINVTFLERVEPWQVFFVEIPGDAYRIGTAESGRYKTGEGTLYIHSYPTEDDALAIARKIPPSADSGATDWAGQPHFYRCGSTIALYLDHWDFGQPDDIQVLETLVEQCGLQFAGSGQQ